MAQDVCALLDAAIVGLAPVFTAVADDIWATPELCFGEHRSAARQIEAMEAQGFRITRRPAGLDTAFMADWGEEGPVIAFLGEFDALPGLSQVAGLACQQPVVQGGNGHGCGHNLLGAGSMLAASALAGVLKRAGMRARVRYYGCPAEEGGWGKAYLVRAGAFNDAAIAIGWHPGTFNGVRARSTLAVVNRAYRFRGTAAHAAMSPHLGRSALDAVELMNIGANFLREHVLPDVRLHYAITDAGGAAPAVVQARAEVLYMIRAPELDMVHDLVARVDDIARGAALMTGTEVDFLPQGGASNVLPNAALCHVMHGVMRRLGRLSFTPDERAFAEEIRETLPDRDKPDRRAVSEPDELLPTGEGRAPLHEGLRPFDGRMSQGLGSTDVGDVTWTVPTVECATATWAVGTPSHSWQVVAQGCTPAAHRAMVRAAVVMAGTALEAIASPSLIREARKEYEERRGGRPYRSLVEGDTPGSAPA
ncbi:aminobenzoyl-glutamate utilization protein B [Pseudaminobacter salicylatoxidans]|uniref:Aminobenzoyl-glutamate utilization protein B n=1 Tax=Pseudaminobacter salicylatoxidans TaxID=93369 RepID=A0A316CAR6_PSESE|nr:amidohydrolase [Pseudaminobacter salicylatoxidans]PWJ86588.1 aminobenzoyl-glutamate utilization protein B [Pseudaminobacter salicylatoxidans]